MAGSVLMGFPVKMQRVFTLWLFTLFSDHQLLTVEVSHG